MRKNETNKALEGLFPTLEEVEEREQIQETKKNEKIETETKKETKSKNNVIIENQKEKKLGRPKINPENPYKITIIVDEEIVDYMKQQPYITMESRKDYINRLIKEDFEKRIGASSQDNQDTIQRKWNDYKERVRRSF